MTGNWWFPWDIYVIPQANGDLKIYKPGRAGDTYTWDAVNQCYVSPPGYFDQMIANSNGTWTRTTKHGVVWQFNTAGYIVSECNRYGLQTTINRDSQNKILSVTDYAGRNTTLAYNSNGYLSTLTDWGGRATTFTWTLQGYLASITYPSTTFYDRVTSALVTRGKTFTFTYQTATGNTNLDGNLLTMVDDRGNAVYSMTFDASDRVTAQTARGGQWTLQYGSVTTVTDPDGVTVAYSFNANNAITRKEIFTRTGLGQTALRTGEPNSYVWQYQRGGSCNCDLVTQITRPDGSTVSKTYDVWGNLTARVEAPPSGSGLPSRTSTWTWSTFSAFCLPLSTTTPMGNATGATPADWTTGWTYDSVGNPTTVTFPKATVSGSLVQPTVTATYNSAGQPLTITWPNGTVYKYEYATTTLELVKVTRDYGTSRLNLLTQYGYDSFSRLASITDPRGNIGTIQYNALDQVTEVQLPGNGGRTRFTYDNTNMLYMVETENLDASGNQVSANPWFTATRDYDSSNRLVSETVEVDASTTATTQHQYTAAGRHWKITDPVGNVTEQIYDERGLLFQYTDGLGTSVAGTTTLSYDLNGKLASVVNPRGYSTSFAFNHEGWAVSQTDPASVSINYAHDLDGRLTQTEYKSASGVTIARSHFTWDPYGLRITTVRDLLNGQGTTTQAFTTSYAYTTNLQLGTVTDALSNTTTRSYDAVGRITQVLAASGDKETYAYDANGNVTARAVHAWNQATSAYDVLVFDSQFDVLDRRTQEVRHDSGSTVSSTRTWTYDSRANGLDATDEAGNTRHFIYDGRGLPTSVTLDLRTGGTGAGSVTSTIVNQVVFDLAGRVTARKDGLNQQTSYAYDARSRVTSETDAASGTRSFTHDANGNVLTITDPLGTVVTNTFDNRDLLTARSVSRASGVIGTTSETYTYSPLGRRLTALDDDSTVRYTYDSLGRILTESEGPNPIGTSGKAFAYGYNAVDGMTSVTFPDATVENRGRDAVQRLTSVSIQSGPTLASYQYAGRRVLQASLQNSVVRQSTFDALWRETVVEYKQGTTSLRKFEYAFNPADYRLLEKRHHASGAGDNYTLDSLYRTVGVKEGVADPVAELASPGSQTYVQTQTPAYDAAQNRTQVAVTPSGGSTTTTSYTADALNFYTAVGGTTEVRDANGNLRDDGTRLYEYDYRNQLCRVTDKATSAVIATYNYDVFGRRIAKATSTTTSFYWAFEAMAMEFDASGQFSRRHFGQRIDEIVGASQRDIADLNGNSSTTDSVWLTPVYDGALDCAAVLGPTGTVAEAYVHSYDGVVTILDAAGLAISTSAIGWQQGYAGMHRDDETGLLYARKRYYSPATARWVTEDPVGRWHDGFSRGNGLAWVGNAYRNATDSFGTDSRTPVKVMAAPDGSDPGTDPNGALAGDYASDAYSGYRKAQRTGAHDLKGMIEAALATVGQCECIEVLFLDSHGDHNGPTGAGGTTMGGGPGEPDQVSNRPGYHELWKKMCKKAGGDPTDGYIVFGGCRVGQNLRFLNSVADAVGVATWGSVGASSSAVPMPSEGNDQNGQWQRSSR
jgi:RHS repeat-associated protein